MAAAAIAEFSTLKLYRDSLRLARYLGSKQGNTEALQDHIRETFRANMGETDPQKIEEQRTAAVRGLSNYMVFESQRMVQDGEVGRDPTPSTQ
mmetsp:Transcript_17984/g.32012  ORF Transcript_17984/g.32012 Transcript_17984/m.32012 type:complete len:93 (-) Transcript_17984:167-445(-)|eukprot:CAMPEP_0177760362 /NCGR_PEP_ID=MMETSP0491_2-20121128/5228_1 /TAXON_ID=63592 /ORGANISM="Tetraselmis chuii, Strain PLY429" /LENGTH=92 /DNA_ID=CAMNT_0019276259 /DNA_START=189 /DNA_END=467 /DNA_ORIENTATION=-